MGIGPGVGGPQMSMTLLHTHTHISEYLAKPCPWGEGLAVFTSSSSITMKILSGKTFVIVRARNLIMETNLFIDNSKIIYIGGH